MKGDEVVLVQRSGQFKAKVDDCKYEGSVWLYKLHGTSLSLGDRWIPEKNIRFDRSK